MTVVPDDNHDVSDENDERPEPKPVPIERLREMAKERGYDDDPKAAAKAAGEALGKLTANAQRTAAELAKSIAIPRIGKSDQVGQGDRIAAQIADANMLNIEALTEHLDAIVKERDEAARKDAEREEREKRALQLTEESAKAAKDSQEVAEQSRNYTKRSYIVAVLALIVAVVAIVVPLVVR